MTVSAEAPKKLKRKDFASDQEVRWCPGCGDYAILAGIQRTLPKLTAKKENVVFVSGIGCAARFPYYMGTYGFHTIHGRAPALATGMKLANPELDVWVITGDGDALSIGGNHLLHALRRNVDLQIILFNNEIYGLTKGQYSPTSRLGQRSPSTPMGSVDRPVSAAQFAMGANSTFFARTVDTNLKHLPLMLERAHGHRGGALVEILQNCVVFNDKAFAHFTQKSTAADRQLMLDNGQPMIFGKERNKGIRLNTKTMHLDVVTLGEDGITVDDLLVHDETNRVLAGMLASLEGREYPVPLGVFYCDSTPRSYDAAVHDQVKQATHDRGEGDIATLLRSGHTWTVE